MHSALLAPSLALLSSLLTGCTGSTGGSSYELDLTPVLPRNQGELMSAIDRMELVVDADGDEPLTYELSSLEEGDSSAFADLPPLDGARLELRGYDGSNLVAFGRTLPLSIDSGTLSVRILVAQVDAFAELNVLPDPVAFGALAAGGDGRFVLFGGNQEGVYSDPSTNRILVLDVAPPTEGLVFEELDVQMPPRDDGGDGRICHSATPLTRGDHDKVGQILVAGGADVLFSEDESVFSPDLATATWSTFLFDPVGEAVDVLPESSAMVQQRCAHTATELPSGDVVLVGGLGVGTPGSFSVQDSAEIYNPVIGGFESVSGTPSGPLLFHAAAAVGDDGVLVCGGLDNNGSAWFASDECDLVSNSGAISDIGQAPAALIHSAMATLPDGRVLLAGGANPDGTSSLYSFPGDVTNEAWIYDSGVWGPADSMTVPRAMHRMVTLPSGDVLVVGGTTEITEFWNIVYGSSNAVPCAELYDVDTGRFGVIGDCDPDSGSGALTQAVAYPQVAVDDDYGALVAGGLSGDEEGATLVDLYVPTP